jgi:WD40 repeat protein
MRVKLTKYFNLYSFKRIIPGFLFLISSSVYAEVNSQDKHFIPTKILLQTAHTQNITHMAFSPDGKYLVSVSEDATFKVMSVKGKLMNTVKAHAEKINYISFSPDGKTFATASTDNTAKVWDILSITSLEKVNPLFTLEHKLNVNQIVYSSDGMTLATVSDDGAAKIWSNDGKLLFTLNGHSDKIKEIIFSPDGKRIATISWDLTARIWTNSGKLVTILKEEEGYYFTGKFSPDGNLFITSGSKGKAKLWNISSAKKLPSEIKEYIELAHDDNYVDFVKFLPNSNLIITASEDKIIKWNYKGEKIEEIKGGLNGISPDGKKIITIHGEQVQIRNLEGKVLHELQFGNYLGGAVFSKDGKLFALSQGFSGLSHTIHIINLEGEVVSGFYDITENIDHILFSPDEKIYVQQTNDDSYYYPPRDLAIIRTIDGNFLTAFEWRYYGKGFFPDSKSLIVTLYGDKKEILNINGKSIEYRKTDFLKIDLFSISHNGNMIAGVSKDKSVKIFDRDGKLLFELAGQKKVDQIFFSPNEKILAVTYHDNTTLIWNLKTRKIMTTLENTDSYYGASFSSNGKLVITRNRKNYNTQIWNKKGKLLYSVEGQFYNLSPDGKKIITMDLYNLIRIWELLPESKVKLVAELKGYGRYTNVHNIKFSFDGKLIIAGGSDGNVLVWDLEGNLFHRLEDHGGEINSFTFINDGKLLVTSAKDNSIKFWDYEKGKLLMTQIFRTRSSCITYTPQGYFDFMKEEDLKYISIRTNNSESGFLSEKEIMKYHVPNLAKKILFENFR